MSNTMSGFYKVCESIFRLIYLNLLWLGFTVLGAIVFGLFPATVAMFGITRKWLKGEELSNVFQAFWGIYKKEFKKSNVLGLILLLIGYLLVVDIKYIQALQEGLLTLLYLPLLVIAVVFLIMLLYIFPLFVHYDIKNIQLIKSSFFLLFSNPIETFLLVAASYVEYRFFMLFPGLLVFFGGSVTALSLTYLALVAFAKNEKKLMKHAA